MFPYICLHFNRSKVISHQDKEFRVQFTDLGQCLADLMVRHGNKCRIEGESFHRSDGFHSVRRRLLLQVVVNDQPVFIQGLCSLFPGKNRHVISGFCQYVCQICADHAGPEDQNLSFLPVIYTAETHIPCLPLHIFPFIIAVIRGRRIMRFLFF